MRIAALTAAFVICSACAASAATLEPIGEFDQPIYLSSDPASPNRLLVVEREGRVLLLEPGEEAVVFADLTTLVRCCASERGLLSIVAAPDFPTSGRFYAAYTGNAAAGGEEGDIHVDAFRHDGAGMLVRERIISIPHADDDNHNGGQLQFGPDGHLYVSVGDGGGAGDPMENGQDLETLLGKILRLDPQPGETPSYEVPAGNPFAASPGRDEIWSYGLRNPWRFSFDRLDGDMVIGDVGQGVREEVDFVSSPGPGLVGGAGDNYGWNCREGFIAYPNAPGSCSGASGFVDPVFDYPHVDPGGGAAHGCSITGGYVSRDPGLPELYGRYVYADFCEGELRSLLLPGAGGGLAGDDRSEGLTVPSPVSFGEDSAGRLYVIARGGSIYRLAAGSVSDPGPATAGPPPLAIARASEPVRVRLTAKVRRFRDAAKVALTVRVVPCAGRAGSRVQLNRGGRQAAGKSLNTDCVARFRRRIETRATFRALHPASGYRSQVLTIALAKPRP